MEATPELKASLPWAAFPAEAQSLVEDMLARFGPAAVFGTPCREGDATVIPVAAVRMGLGLGFGRGPRVPRTYPASGTAASLDGGGGGGGLSARAVPYGFIHVGPSGSWFTPTPDVTRLALSGMALSAFLAFVLGRTLNRRNT